ncbi:MAG: hypothetical protein ACREJO_10095 [Phycisphaerales bacterium]
MNKTIPLALLLAAGTLLSGCYKSEFEAEKAKNTEHEAKIATLEKDLAAARGEATTAKQRLASEPGMRAQAGGMQLATYVNGVREGTDALGVNAQGELVRNGIRKRDNSEIRYDMGRIADQVITINSSATKKPYITGVVKNSAPEGDWIWYNSDGKPTNKEVWKDGKLIELYSAGAAGKDGQPTWKKMSNAERDDWFKRKTATFMNFPELNRQLGTAPPPAAPATGTTPPKTGTTPGTTPPKPGTTPPKPGTSTPAKPR